MACQNNANRSAGAGLKSGVSSLAGKAAYLTGVGIGIAGGSMAGSLTGAFLGAAGGPTGMAIGGGVGAVTGGYLGVRLVNRGFRKQREARAEQRWQQSPAGRQAMEERTRMRGKIREKYKPQLAKLKRQQAETRSAYDQAMERWLLRQKTDSPGGLKGVVLKPETRAAANLAGQAAVGLASTYLLNSRWGLTTNPKKAAAGAAVVAVRNYGDQVKAERRKAFETSPEGQTAVEMYRQRMTTLKRRYNSLKTEYGRRISRINQDYDQARARFLAQPGE